MLEIILSDQIGEYDNMQRAQLVMYKSLLKVNLAILKTILMLLSRTQTLRLRCIYKHDRSIF